MFKLYFAGLMMAAACVPVASNCAEVKARELSWEVKLLGQHIDTCPAVERDGTIYVTVSGNTNYGDPSGGKLVAIAPNGARKWSFLVKTDTRSSPGLGGDGTIYFGCRDKMLHAIAPDGQEKWNFPTGAWVDASPAIAANETVYFGSWDGNFYAVGPDGKKRWEFATKGPIESSAAIGVDGTIYFGSHDKFFYALNPDGTLKWKFATAGEIISSPAINSAGEIYLTSVDGKLYLLKPDGKEKWHLWTGGIGPSSPVIDADGFVYLGVNNTFWYVNPDGTKKWYFGYPVVNGSAAVMADGMIIFQGSGTMLEFDKSGDEKSYTFLGGQDAASSPAITGEGNILIGDQILQLYKGSAALSKGPWPKFRGGPRQTGRVDDN